MIYEWMVILPAFCAGSLPLFSPYYYQEILTGFELMLMEWMTDSLMDQHMNPAIIMGISP